MSLVRRLHTIWGAACLCVALCATTVAAEPQEVRVKNFPETQHVRGSVAIEGTVSHARHTKLDGLVIPTSRRNDSTDAVYAGRVDAAGFTDVTISLQGEVKSSNFNAGSVGVMLIPDEEPILRAYREGKQVQFALEASTDLKPGDSEYFSAQSRLQLAFPWYRIYLYNTLNRTIEANVYLHLSN